MSDSDGEQAARSVALEQAYVHEVYEQCAEKTAQTRHWPRIYQFLEELEPGALVCDIGCGNGKYLSVNHSVFKVGVDRCKRFTGIARQKENEVLICDNLALPFRDESFDAVLSVAVVHHFATTERRVHALKELTRVLRIGGRLVISVWAMEQRHRKFESQDVLIPWPKVYCVNTSSSNSNGLSVPNIGSKAHDQPNKKYISSSKRSSQNKCKNESYWIDPIFTPSPSVSSPSSPNETCYSFFRRALQKLAGGRRGSTVRPWFLDTWQNGGGKSRSRYDIIDDTADVDELPIELRRLEDTNTMLNSKQLDTFSMKSKSLGDILEIQRPDFVRSRSSIPGLSSTLTSDLSLDETSRAPSSLTDLRPPLVKQDSQFDDDVVRDNVKSTAIREVVHDLSDIQIESTWYTRRGNVQKQNSMNEELMSADRLREKERVRRNIMKQASLNEDIICKRRTLENFKDSIYSGYATKKLQLLKNDLTSRLKQSTTNIERVSGMSIKNGFVRILQGWKSSDNEPVNMNDSNEKAAKDKQPVASTKPETNEVERRLSKEDGSDSSKDSSLQSDTSVDSEDSFASVIYVPKQEPPLINGVQSFGISSSTPSGCQLSTTTSAPPSPRVKHSPDLPSLHLKLISITPLLKQFPATSKSLPPPSPPGLSLRTSFNSITTRPFFPKTLAYKERDIQKEGTKENFHGVSTTECEPEKVDKVKPSCGYPMIPEHVNANGFVSNVEDNVPLICASSIEEKLSHDRSSELVNEEESRITRLNQIKELLNQRPGFATRIKPSFPLVRRASTATNGQIEAVTRVLPRLLSLELFNPETDDLDSDSSGVSSPESVGSVISVISDERYIVKEDAAKSVNDTNRTESPEKATLSKQNSIAEDDTPELKSDKDNADFKIQSDTTTHLKTHRVISPTQNPQEEKEGERKEEDDDVTSASQIHKSLNSSNDDYYMETTWSDKCHQHILEFTGELEKNLINDIDQYCKQDFNFDEPVENKEEERTKKSNKSLVSCDKIQIDLNDSNECLLDAESLKDDEVLDFVLVSNAGKFSDNSEEHTSLSHRGISIESSDIGDSIENTYSNSSHVDPEKCCKCTTTVSILTNKNDSKSKSNNNNNKGTTNNKEVYSRITDQRRRFSIQRRSASEEIPSRESKGSAECLIAASNGTLVSAASSSSQESLPSDLGGGAITYHQYYHVFREGELDQLIKKYVENLHIISSYYDHASWCIVAEKVQVWTI